MKGAELTLTLSDLPDLLIGETLGRLPIKEAGRTSVLSRSWRHRWRSMLDLDLSGVSDPLVISQVLLLHHAPLRLFKAQIDFCSPSCSKRSCSPIIPCWISSLSHRSSSTLRSLSLKGFFCDLCCTLVQPPPTSLNAVASCFPNLTHLRLQQCNLPLSPSSFKGFPSLRSLQLKRDASCDSHISFFISTCPLLEELTLIDLRQSFDSLDIVAPNLRHLRIVDPGSCHLSISEAPLLETALIELSADGHTFIGNVDLVIVLGAIASVEHLKLGFSVLESWARDLIQRGNGCVPLRIPVNLYHLRSLSLAVHFESQASLVPCLLRSCPNLKRLEIKDDWYGDELLLHVEEGFWEVQEPISVLDRLETVKMTLVKGVKHELDFIGFLLARALRLQTLTISFNPTSENVEIAKTELLKYPRASSQARILVKTNIGEAVEWR